MASSQSTFIFGYGKKEMEALRVNDIMPKLFSEHHDSILEKFLVNKNKKVNTDQRHLLGKDADGYVFPMILQLQKVLSTSVDELFFISNITRKKNQRSFICCTIDNEGEILEFSSLFRELFFTKNAKRLRNYNKNIQLIIPDFFSTSGEEEDVKLFKEKVKYDDS